MTTQNNLESRRPYRAMQVFPHTHDKIVENSPAEKENLRLTLEAYEELSGQFIVFGPDNGNPFYYSFMDRETLFSKYDMDPFDDSIKMYLTQPVYVYPKN